MSDFEQYNLPTPPEVQAGDAVVPASSLSGKSETFDSATLSAPPPVPTNEDAQTNFSQGTISNDFVAQSGRMQSGNFVSGSSGWQLRPDGAEINGGVSVGSINIPDTTTDSSFHVDSSGNTWWGNNVADGYASAPAYVLANGTAVFSSITVTGYTPVTRGTFGGDGSDGALTISSGTTTLSFASASFLVKNYTSISITSTGKLAVSTPNTSGSTLILRSQGAVVITSSATCIDVSGMGGAGGAGVTSSTNASGSNGTAGQSVIFVTNPGTAGAGVSTAGTGGAAVNSVAYPSAFSQQTLQYPTLLVGSGGGGGGTSQNTNSATSGNGGNGGGGLVIECAGAWNFTTASGISAAGANGTNGVDGSGPTGTGAGGGGGGSGGFVLCLYNTLTANTGTIVVTGGTGGNGGSVNLNSFHPGGGGGGFMVAGSNGNTNTAANAKTGGDGAVGYSLVAQNSVFS